ncbi:hypothetical protein, partial [Nostoc sp.]|uniref:hypothetical protein n=1 Tax=Nostoc sp. TaxID=1180 RepID=UPI002FFB0E77
IYLVNKVASYLDLIFAIASCLPNLTKPHSSPSSSTTKIVPFSPDKFLNAVPFQRELLTIHYLLIRSQNHKTILKYSHDEEAIA